MTYDSFYDNSKSIIVIYDNSTNLYDYVTDPISRFVVRIIKLNDDFYIVDSHIYFTHKCDQLNNLLKCISSEIKLWIEEIEFLQDS